MSRNTVLRALSRELAFLGPRYDARRLDHPVLATYDSLDALFAATEPKQQGKKKVVSPEGSAVLVALVELHGRTRDRLWGALLLRAFEPMLLRVARHLKGGSRADRDATLLMSFHEALLRVDTRKDPLRIAMYVRQETRRRVFRALGGELEWQDVEFGDEADDVDDSVDPTPPPEPSLLDRRWKASKAVLKGAPPSLLATTEDRGALWTLVRKEHGHLPAKEQARIYRRLQKRRHRVVGRLRDRLLAERRPATEEATSTVRSEETCLRTTPSGSSVLSMDLHNPTTPVAVTTHPALPSEVRR
jgi:hypothetical protein